MLLGHPLKVLLTSAAAITCVQSLITVWTVDSLGRLGDYANFQASDHARAFSILPEMIQAGVESWYIQWSNKNEDLWTFRNHDDAAEFIRAVEESERLDNNPRWRRLNRPSGKKHGTFNFGINDGYFVLVDKTR